MRVNPNFTSDMVNLMDQAQQAEDNAAEQLSTGRRVNLPSDDPAAEAAMIEENSQSAAVDQYTANSRFAHRRAQHRRQHPELRRHPAPASQSASASREPTAP